MKEIISIFIALLCFINTGSAQFDERIISGINTGDQSYNISVALDHIFISKENNLIEISEIVVFRNEGEEIQYNKNNHTFFAISTPPDIINLKAQAMECCLVQDEGIVYIDPMKSIPPGSNFDMQISYALNPRDQKYIFNKSAIYNTTSISMLIDKKSGIDMEGSSDVMILSGNEYNVITFRDIRAGEIISIPVKITQDSGYLYEGIGLLLLFSAGLVYLFKGRIFLRKIQDSTLEELEIEKRKIFRTIHGFEKHAGPEISEEYQKLMEEYRQKGIRICFKIENFKKTNTSLRP